MELHRGAHDSVTVRFRYILALAARKLLLSENEVTHRCFSRRRFEWSHISYFQVFLIFFFRTGHSAKTGDTTNAAVQVRQNGFWQMNRALLYACHSNVSQCYQLTCHTYLMMSPSFLPVLDWALPDMKTMPTIPYRHLRDDTILRLACVRGLCAVRPIMVQLARTHTRHGGRLTSEC